MNEFRKIIKGTGMKKHEEVILKFINNLEVIGYNIKK